ncbi:MAG: MerR family transcriptional regulator [Rhodoferax sp.]|nr:MerR family transcriptional regulator [Rhodoferax sp.]
MNERVRTERLTLSIAAVERDTGLSKDTLRVWERRYNFPVPGRDAQGERAYPLDQVEKLRLLKRLLDAGHRPGRVVPLSMADLDALASASGDAARPAPPPVLAPDDVQEHLALIRAHDARGLRRALLRLLARAGVTRFVLDVMGPLNVAVGDAWIRGQLEIFEEHLYSEVIQGVMRQALASVPEPRPEARPRVLLTTFPGESHGLGLLMAEAVLALDGADCLSLGVQTPLWDVVLAAQAYRADVVALGFTGVMNPNQVVDGLLELRSKLPESTALWAGGSAPVLHRRPLDGVLALASLQALPEALEAWRLAHNG